MDDGMKRVTRERLEPYFRLHKEANFTMVRNWTGESTEELFMLSVTNMVYLFGMIFPFLLKDIIWNHWTMIYFFQMLRISLCVLEITLPLLYGVHVMKDTLLIF